MDTNKIYQIDARKGMKKLDDNSVDLVLTDPPYGINYQTNRRNDEDHEFTEAIANDDNLAWLDEFVGESYRVLKENTALYCFSSSDRIASFHQSIRGKFDIKNTIIWVKNNWTAGDLKAQYGKQYEMIVYANKGRCKIRGKRWSDVWNEKKIAGNNQYHQNQKPKRLLESIIKKSTDEGNLVVDPFIGSGSTAVAARSLNRDFIGFDIEEKYVDIAEKRLSGTQKVLI